MEWQQLTRKALFIDQYLDDTVGRSSVPSVGNARFLPFASQQDLRHQYKTVSILAHQHIGTDLHGLDMLGIAIERDTRHTVEGGFFCHIS